MYVANNLCIIVFLFCIDSIEDLTMHIMVYLLYYVIKILYVYKILCSQQNMYTVQLISLLLSKNLYV